MTDEHETSARRSLIERWFPTRYLYLRSGDDIRAVALTPRRQMLGVGAGVAVAAWVLLSSGGFALDLAGRFNANEAVQNARAASERVNADLQARLDTAVARMSATTLPTASVTSLLMKAAGCSFAGSPI